MTRWINDAPAAAVRYGLAVLLVTSAHHVYGAWRYDTPWRLHAVYLAAFTAVVMLGALAVRRRAPGRKGAVAGGVLIGVTLIVPVALFGVYEGLYNHVLKNLLYVGGASADVMARFFPPAMYEMPDDAVFELSGMLHVLPAAAAAWQLLLMVRNPDARPRQAAGGGIGESHGGQISNA